MVSPDPVLPLVLTDGTGFIHSYLLMNSKGFNKSIENHELWIVHPVTNRLLPLEGGVFESMQKSPLHYTAVVNRDVLGRLEKPLFELGRAVQQGNERVDPLGTPLGPSPTNGEDFSRSTSLFHRLAEVIQARRLEMPEGSYTTHLFQKGEEKIRKKMGEEAIELLLARSSKEMIYESADLLYHMMVLFEVSTISLDDVLGELESRIK